MKLTAKQQKTVEDNMGLVGQVIKDKVHGVTNLGIYTYDDLFQIGCIGLCKAVYTDHGGSCLSTYAYRLIWNEICDALIYATRRSAAEHVTDPEMMPVDESRYNAVSPELRMDLYAALRIAEKTATGVTAKGVKALQLMSEGYTCKEIGKRMNASANNVTAWISKARKYLQSLPEVRNLKPEASV